MVETLYMGKLNKCHERLDVRVEYPIRPVYATLFLPLIDFRIIDTALDPINCIIVEFTGQIPNESNC